MIEDCIFCTLEENIERNVIWQNDNFIVFLDQFPLNFGHSLIIPKRHVNKIDQLKSEEFENLQEAIREAKKVPEKKIVLEKYRHLIRNPISEKSKKFTENVVDEKNQEPDGFNIGINEGKVAGQTIDHLHIQIIPRYKGDVENPTGGIRNIMPEKGDYT